MPTDNNEPYYKFVKGRGWVCGYWPDEDRALPGITFTWTGRITYGQNVVMMPRAIMYADDI